SAIGYINRTRCSQRKLDHFPVGRQGLATAALGYIADPLIAAANHGRTNPVIDDKYTVVMPRAFARIHIALQAVNPRHVPFHGYPKCRALRQSAYPNPLRTEQWLHHQ